MDINNSIRFAFVLITTVNLLYSIFCNTGRVWYDVIPSIEERRYEELFDVV